MVESLGSFTSGYPTASHRHRLTGEGQGTSQPAGRTEARLVQVKAAERRHKGGGGLTSAEDLEEPALKLGREKVGTAQQCCDWLSQKIQVSDQGSSFKQEEGPGVTVRTPRDCVRGKRTSAG